MPAFLLHLEYLYNLEYLLEIVVMIYTLNQDFADDIAQADHTKKD
jgi:hypothetical protein